LAADNGMQSIKFYQIDAFAERLFSGNPAAVCVLDEPMANDLCQAIAAENNLSETAFVHLGVDGWQIRWFTPSDEVELCGHATLAAGFVLIELERVGGQSIEFSSAGGPLTVSREGSDYWLDFPAWPPVEVDADARLLPALGLSEQDLYGPVMMNNDYLLVLKDRAALRATTPDFTRLLEVEGRGAIVTAPDDDYDFVSRFFAPKVGVNEDPVTGSAHCLLIPYWSKRLNKVSLRAYQASARGGAVKCQMVEVTGGQNRVLIGGQAQLYLAGRLQLPS